MSILDFNDDENFGKIIAVDTATVTVRVDELERLKCQRRSKISPMGGVKVVHLRRTHETAGRA